MPSPTLDSVGGVPPIGGLALGLAALVEGHVRASRALRVDPVRVLQFD